jgi:trk system potassium uptake protein TrkH
LIILGGLGFSVLYDLFSIAAEKVRRFFKWRLDPAARLTFQSPVQMRLQSKIVLVASAGLILAGALAIMLFEHYTGEGSSKSGGFGGALFQSITARTAGFNTVDVAKLSPVSRTILMLLMFVGGSPGSTAGGIKTVTFAVVIMTVVASLRKRSEVEMFRRSVRLVVIGRAVTVTVLFVLVLFTATFLLTITERASGFDMSQIAFEAGSALGTVGLTTGITPDLTSAGKLIIIATMLVGRLGPLTLLAALTFNIKPAKYNYADEAIIVG